MEAGDQEGGARGAVAAGELAAHDALELARLVRTCELHPVELVEQAIRSIEALNPALNAVVHKTYERALQRAAAPLPPGPLAGVPLVVKDNATIAGVPSTRGSRALRDHVPQRTAPFFTAAEEAGLIVVGVTNMSELGLIDGTENALYGATRNPWNREYSPGGSSGGSAACVAAGVVPLAHGTDGGGSIRIPASHCGLFGLKPSRGRLPAGSFASPAWPRLVEGCLSRSVRDSAMYLHLLQARDADLPPLHCVAHPSARRLRIALMYEAMGGEAPHPEVRRAVTETAELCRALGHVVEETAPQLDQARLAEAARRAGAVEVAKTLDAIAASRGIVRLEDAFESRALGLRESALRRGPFAVQLHAALPVLKAGALALDAFFRQWDVLLSPVLRSPVFRIGERDQSKFGFEALDAMLHNYVAYTPLHNICGTPAMSVPLHRDSRGLPLGSQFAARRGDEATLLALACELEEARPWKSGSEPEFAAALI